MNKEVQSNLYLTVTVVIKIIWLKSFTIIYTPLLTSDRTFLGYRVMMSNTTFNNISVISWWSVLMVEETGVPRENHPPAASHWHTWSHNVA